MRCTPGVFYSCPAIFEVPLYLIIDRTSDSCVTTHVAIPLLNIFRFHWFCFPAFPSYIVVSLYFIQIFQIVNFVDTNLNHFKSIFFNNREIKNYCIFCQCKIREKTPYTFFVFLITQCKQMSKNNNRTAHLKG